MLKNQAWSFLTENITDNFLLKRQTFFPKFLKNNSSKFESCPIFLDFDWDKLDFTVLPTGRQAFANSADTAKLGAAQSRLAIFEAQLTPRCVNQTSTYVQMEHLCK